MKRDEQSDKNLDLARAFFTGLLDEPVERWPESGTLLVALPLNAPELSEANNAAIAEIQERHPALAVERTDMIGTPIRAKASDNEPLTHKRAL